MNALRKALPITWIGDVFASIESAPDALHFSTLTLWGCNSPQILSGKDSALNDAMW